MNPPERPSINPLSPFQDTHNNNASEHEQDDDIYRGQSPSPSSHSHFSQSSTSSASSWSFFNGRLGAFTTIVSNLEKAMSGWRGNNSSSSSSSSSTATLTRSQLSKRKRRGSTADLHSERDFSARISIIKAREESRITPRQFTFYPAPSLRDTASYPTSSLDTVLNQLDAALKKTTRTRRNREIQEKDLHPSLDLHGDAHQHIMLPENLKAPSRAASFTDLAALRKARRGKAKEGLEDVSHSIQAVKPWFLDVASPTSEDMRAIGKLLHLHPLTLEDILQQDPREKLELFPKLGYYFISFRSIDNRTIRAKLECQVDNYSDTLEDEGLVAESNVYLVVFNEGVCSFHFMDASEHIDRVRSRMISLEKTISMSSAWIAHSLLDSIVDSFFPFSDEIEKEVMEIEHLVYSDDMTAQPDALRKLETVSHNPEMEHVPVLSEKNLSKHEGYFGTRTRFAVSRPPLPLLYRRLLRSIRSRWQPSVLSEKPPPLSSTMITLRRMARTRRLVTSLARLLATKSEVAAQIRKRLLTGSGNGKVSSSEELEVAIYMGDVQDHILTLQHALAHFEHMLSQFYPTYLQQLHAHVSLTKSSADNALVYLTTVSMAVLSLQTLLAMFSQNVTLPSSPNSYHVFGIIVAGECLVLSAYLLLVRHWWKGKKMPRNVLG